MEIKNYIIGKLVPDMLRQKIIDIKGCDETEFINIDSVEVTELNEAFALTKPFAVDVTLSRYCERDVKHQFHLVVKVSAGVCLLHSVIPSAFTPTAVFLLFACKTGVLAQFLRSSHVRWELRWVEVCHF